MLCSRSRCCSTTMPARACVSGERTRGVARSGVLSSWSATTSLSVAPPRACTKAPTRRDWRAGRGSLRPSVAWNVVIAGGGFGGYYAARTLERAMPAHAARITLVNDVNFLLYTPLLPGAAGGTLEPRHVVVPLREELD